MEFTGTTAALHLLDHLLHAEDARTRHAVDTRTFYVVPRVNPDGAEAGLADGRFRRSSVRPYPREEPEDGLHREDVDADGRVLFMRLPDPNGSWKPHPDDARLLIARRPDDIEGDFYRVLPEGTIRNWDGVNIPDRPAARRARPEPQLAGRLGARGRATRRGPVPDVRARGAGARRDDRRAQEHHVVRRLPHVLGRPPPTVVGPSRRRLPGAGPPCVHDHGRRGHAPHRLPVDLDLPRLQVPPEARHQGRRRRLDLRPPRRVCVGDGVLEPTARRRALRLPLHRLDPRALARGRPRGAEGRRRARRGLRRLVPVRAPAARPDRARRLGPRPLLVQPAALPPRGRGEAARRFRGLPRPRLPPARGPLVRVGARGRRRVPATARARERRLAPDERLREGAGAAGGAPDRGRARAPRRHEGSRRARSGRRPVSSEGESSDGR